MSDNTKGMGRDKKSPESVIFQDTYSAPLGVGWETGNRTPGEEQESGPQQAPMPLSWLSPYHPRPHIPSTTYAASAGDTMFQTGGPDTWENSPSHHRSHTQGSCQIQKQWKETAWQTCRDDSGEAQVQPVGANGALAESPAFVSLVKREPVKVPDQGLAKNCRMLSA